MAAPADPTRPTAPRVPPALIGAGVLVVAVGFGLPQLLPSIPSDPKATPPAASATAPAAPPPVAAPAAPDDGPGLGVSLARLAGCFVVVCGLCVLAARFLGTKTTLPKGSMHVLAALPIDGRCSVYLVKAGDRRLLVGLDAGGVKSLVELPGPPPDAALPDPPAEPVAVSAPAAPVVVGPVKVTAPAAPAADDIAALIARLRTTIGEPRA